MQWIARAWGAGLRSGGDRGKALANGRGMETSTMAAQDPTETLPLSSVPALAREHVALLF